MESGPEAAYDDVSSLLAAKDAENVALRGEIAAVRDENAALLARVTQLEGLVAALQVLVDQTARETGARGQVYGPVGRYDYAAEELM